MKFQIAQSTFSLVASLLVLSASSAFSWDEPLSASTSVDDGHNWDGKMQEASIGPILLQSTSERNNSSARVFVDYGIIKLFAEADNTDSGSSQASAGGVWRDVIVFEAPDLAGQPGSAVLNYRIDGNFDLTAGYPNSYDYIDFNIRVSARNTSTGIRAYNSYYFTRYADNSTYVEVRENGEYAENPDILDYLNANLFLTADFTYGAPLELEFSIGVGSYASWSNTHGIVDFGHTATWEGITDVVDSGGDPVGFTLSSTSGTNYINPIPEPSTMALLVGSGAFVVGLTRRRIRRA